MRVVVICVGVYWLCALCAILVRIWILLACCGNVRTPCSLRGDCLHIVRMLLVFLYSFCILFYCGFRLIWRIKRVCCSRILCGRIAGISCIVRCYSFLLGEDLFVLFCSVGQLSCIFLYFFLLGPSQQRTSLEVPWWFCDVRLLRFGRCVLVQAVPVLCLQCLSNGVGV